MDQKRIDLLDNICYEYNQLLNSFNSLRDKEYQQKYPDSQIPNLCRAKFNFYERKDNLALIAFNSLSSKVGLEDWIGFGIDIEFDKSIISGIPFIIADYKQEDMIYISSDLKKWDITKKHFTTRGVHEDLFIYLSRARRKVINKISTFNTSIDGGYIVSPETIVNPQKRFERIKIY